MNEIIIPLAGIFALFIFPASIALIAVLKWHKGRNRLYQSIDDAIEKGAPPEVISQLVAMTESKEEKKPPTSRSKHLSNGAVLLALGIAFLVLRYLGMNSNMIYPGVFATALGLAFLCIGAFFVKDDPTDSE